MTTFQISPPSTATAHGAQRMTERRITWTDLALAAADPTDTTRIAGDRLKVRGRNGITYISDLTGAVVITTFREDARRPAGRPNAGRSRHLTRTRPGKRRDSTRPRR